MAQDVAHINYYRGVASFQDCQFHGGQILDTFSTVSLTNCLLERVNVQLEQGDDPNFATFQNNLIFGGTFYFGPWTSTSSVIKDNFFDTTNVNVNLTGLGYSGGYNAFSSTNRIFPTKTTDLLLTNATFIYQTGPLGSFYQPTNSALINAGSVTNAALVGLFHHTTQTNQICEANSALDIAFHYVAVDANGNPIDSDSDGVANYAADNNGNGVLDFGEIPFGITIENPANGAVVSK